MKSGINKESAKMVEMFLDDETVLLTKEQATELFTTWQADDNLRDDLWARRIMKAKIIR